jgi:hypothetical protein
MGRIVARGKITVTYKSGKRVGEPIFHTMSGSNRPPDSANSVSEICSTSKSISNSPSGMASGGHCEQGDGSGNRRFTSSSSNAR